MGESASQAIALVSMPGGGKSTVGRQLARALSRRFIDTDTEVERRIGGTIREFFDRAGEEAFRDLEEEVVGTLMSNSPDAVVATGGGSILRASNRAVLRDHAVVFYLRATPEELFRRLRRDTQRPLLQVRDPLRRLRELFAERDPLYRETAHYVVDTGRPSVPMLVNMILAQLELAGLVDPNAARKPPR